MITLSVSEIIVYAKVSLRRPLVGCARLMPLFQEFWAFQFLFIITVTSIKISILLFYRRIFTTRRFAIAANIVGFIQVAWCISIGGSAIFSCDPVAYFWDKLIPDGHCININTLRLVGDGLNFIADILVLCLPIPSLWGLQIPFSRKLALIGMFVLGGM